MKDTLYYKLANFYWLYSSKKDYKKESNFIDNQFEKYKIPEKSILDIGCGQGDHLNELNLRGYDVFGLDKSELQIKEAQKKFKNLKFESKDFETYIGKTKYGGAIMLWNTLLYFSPSKNLSEILKKVNRNLQEEGLFLFEFRSFYEHIINREFKSKLKRELKKEGYTMELETTNKINYLEKVLVEKTSSKIYNPDGKLVYKQKHSPVNLNILSLNEMKNLLKSAKFEILNIYDMDALFKDNPDLMPTEKSRGYCIIAKKE
jgi:SAM-dependent methyltransferase